MPHKPEIRRRRALVLYVDGATAENDVSLQAKHREGRTEDPPGKDKNSQQPKLEQKKRSGDQQHQSRGVTGA